MAVTKCQKNISRRLSQKPAISAKNNFFDKVSPSVLLQYCQSGECYWFSRLESGNILDNLQY